jgi:hypothetical protein
MKNTMNIFAQTLAVGGTIYTKSAARITGDKVGADNYAKWKITMEFAHRAFYGYKKAVDDMLRGREADVKLATDNAMTALQTVLDLIGEINGHKLVKSQELLDEVAKYAVGEKTELVGDAFTIASKLKNCNLCLKDAGYNAETGKAHNGVNPEYIKKLLEEQAELEEELKIVKKSAGSGVAVDVKKSFTAFCTDFERKLAKLSNDQSMKTWEELEAEEEARRKERRAKTKAKKAEKAKAEAAAKAQA